MSIQQTIKQLKKAYGLSRKDRPPEIITLHNQMNADIKRATSTWPNGSPMKLYHTSIIKHQYSGKIRQLRSSIEEKSSRDRKLFGQTMTRKHAIIKIMRLKFMLKYGVVYDCNAPHVKQHWEKLCGQPLYVSQLVPSTDGNSVNDHSNGRLRGFVRDNFIRRSRYHHHNSSKCVISWYKRSCYNNKTSCAGLTWRSCHELVAYQLDNPHDANDILYGFIPVADVCRIISSYKYIGLNSMPPISTGVISLPRVKLDAGQIATTAAASTAATASTAASTAATADDSWMCAIV
jgi:hypothetical protein